MSPKALCIYSRTFSLNSSRCKISHRLRLPSPLASAHLCLLGLIWRRSGLGKKRLFQFWLNTRFVAADGFRTELAKLELDKACKDTKHKKYPPSFKVGTATHCRTHTHIHTHAHTHTYTP